MFGLSITERGHRILREYIRKGDVAVDCTAGHGLDTLFLAECVGEKGAVHAFEIQVKAINELHEKFRENPRGLLCESVEIRFGGPAYHVQFGISARRGL